MHRALPVLAALALVAVLAASASAYFIWCIGYAPGEPCFQPSDVQPPRATAAGEYDFTKPLPASTRARLADLEPAIRRVAAEEGVPARLLRAFILQESGGNPLAVGAAGECGLTQQLAIHYRPGALCSGFAYYPRPTDAALADPASCFIPENNLRCGARIMKSFAASGGIDVQRAAFDVGAAQAIACRYNAGLAGCRNNPPRTYMDQFGDKFNRVA